MYKILYKKRSNKLNVILCVTIYFLYVNEYTKYHDLKSDDRKKWTISSRNFYNSILGSHPVDNMIISLNNWIFDDDRHHWNESSILVQITGHFRMWKLKASFALFSLRTQQKTSSHSHFYCMVYFLQFLPTLFSLLKMQYLHYKYKIQKF